MFPTFPSVMWGLPAHDQLVDMLSRDPQLREKVRQLLEDFPAVENVPHPAAEEISSRFAARVEGEFPMPIAAAWAIYRRKRDRRRPELGTPYVFLLLDGLLRFLAALSVSEARRRALPIGLPATILERLRHSPPSAGHLLQIALFAARAVDGTDCPELLSLVTTRDVSAMLGKAIRLRNKIAHPPARISDHRDLARALTHVLQMLADQLKDALLFVPDTIQMNDGLHTVECWLFRGASALPEKAVFKTDQPFLTNVVYVKLPGADTVLPLEPFFRFDRCPEEGCGDQHLFEWMGVDGKKTKYVAIGLLDEHRSSLSGAGEEVGASLQGQWTGAAAPSPERFVWLEGSDGQSDIRRKGSSIGRFEVQEHLGRGGMADVYSVRDRVSGDERAAKLISYVVVKDRQLLARLKREHRLLGLVRHENVVEVYEQGTDRGDHYLIEELAPGWPTDSGKARDLGALRKPVPWMHAVHISRQIARGLAEIHSRRIIHRDLKPSNVLLFRDGVCKIADFGVSRKFGDETMTMTGVAVGTPRYMSPEQAERKALDATSDLYSLGVVMLELLVGPAAFSVEAASGPFDARRPRSTADVLRLAGDVPPALDQLVLRLLARTKEGRFPSALAVVHRLDALIEAAGGTS